MTSSRFGHRLVSCVAAFAVGAVLSGVAGCGGGRTTGARPATPSSTPVGAADRPAPPPDAVTLTSNDGAYRVAYRPEPAPIPLNEPFRLSVWVTDAGGAAPVPGDLVLWVDAAMPHHQHGMNTQPSVRRLGDGRFDVDGMLFHMAGRWELYFDVTLGAITERAQTDVNLE